MPHREPHHRCVHSIFSGTPVSTLHIEDAPSYPSLITVWWSSYLATHRSSPPECQRRSLLFLTQCGPIDHLPIQPSCGCDAAATDTVVCRPDQGVTQQLSKPPVPVLDPPSSPRVCRLRIQTAKVLIVWRLYLRDPGASISLSDKNAAPPTQRTVASFLWSSVAPVPPVRAGVGEASHKSPHEQCYLAPSFLVLPLLRSIQS